MQADEIETQRLILRPVVAGDAEHITPLLADWDVARMLARVPFPYGLDDAKGWTSANLSSADKYVRAIALKSDDVDGPVGCIGIERKEEGGPMELGYWIGKPYWGRGYAGEAVAAILAHAFGCLGHRHLIASHFVDNPASGRVLRRAGFREIRSEPRWSEARQAKVLGIVLELERSMFEASCPARAAADVRGRRNS